MRVSRALGRVAVLGTLALLAVAMVTPVASAEVTLHLFHMTWIPEEIQLIDEAVATFEKANPGVRIIQTRVSWTDAPGQLLTSIMGGSPPDITLARPSMVAQFRSMGAFADITDAIDPSLKKELLPAALQIVQTESGRLDGIPTEGCTWAWFYRKDWFGQAGLGVPQTWDDVLRAAKALTKDVNGDGTPDQWGLAWPLQAENAHEYWLPWVWQAGSQVVERRDGKWVSDLDSPEALAGTQFMVDLVQKHRVTPATIVDMDWEAITTGFTLGKFAMIQNGAWVVGTIQGRAPELAGKWGTFIAPSGPAGRWHLGWPNSWHVLKASRNQDLALKFLNFLYTKGRKPNLTYADEYALIPTSLNWTSSFIAYARNTYDPLLRPFIDNLEWSRPWPLAPAWEQFAELYAKPYVQDMVQGRVTVKDALATLHQRFGELQR